MECREISDEDVLSFSSYFDFKEKKISSLDGLYKVDKLFLLNLNGSPKLYAQLSESEETEEVEELIEDQEEVVEEVVQQEEDPYVVFDEELIVDEPEPEIFEIEELPGDEEEIQIETHEDESQEETFECPTYEQEEELQSDDVGEELEQDEMYVYDDENTEVEEKWSYVESHKQYSCNFCGKLFPLLKYVKSHLKVHENIMCPYCGSSDFKDLKSHMKKCELYEGAITKEIGPHYKLCLICDKFFLDSLFGDHMKKFHKNASDIELRPKVIEYDDHAVKGHKGACDFCGLSDFQTILAFEDHKNSHQEIYQESYTCICGFITTDHFELLTHLAGTEEDTCTLSSTTWPSYAAQYKNKYSVKPLTGSIPLFKCFHCELTFHTLKGLSMHSNSKHNANVIVCEHTRCRKKYGTMSAYRRHLKEKHSKVMVCNFCGESLSRFEADFHLCQEKIDSSEPCPICDEQVIRLEEINHFEDPAHRLLEDAFMHRFIREKRVPCCVCEGYSKDYKDILTLLMHGQEVHGPRRSQALLRSIKEIKEGKPIESDGDKTWLKSDFNWDTDSRRPVVIACRFCNVQTVMSGNYVKRHFASQNKLHDDQTKKWMKDQVLDYVPCPKCSITTLKEIWEGLDHYERVHNSNPMEFYDYISEYRNALSVPDKTYDCMFCGTVFNANHIRSHFDYKNVSHNINIKKWKNHTKNAYFPCRHCDKKKMTTILQALDHYEKDHQLPAISCYIDYCDQVDEDLKLNRKECYLCQEKFPTIWVDLPYHFQKNTHLIHYKQWQIKNYMNYFPCSDCDIHGLTTMNDAMSHYVSKHRKSEDKYYDYFILFSEELKANTLESEDADGKHKNFLPMRDGKVAIPRLKPKEAPAKVRIEPARIELKRRPEQKALKVGRVTKLKKIKMK